MLTRMHVACSPLVCFYPVYSKNFFCDIFKGVFGNRYTKQNTILSPVVLDRAQTPSLSWTHQRDTFSSNNIMFQKIKGTGPYFCRFPWPFNVCLGILGLEIHFDRVEFTHRKAVTETNRQRPGYVLAHPFVTRLNQNLDKLRFLQEHWDP